jgi:hypothetical protein
MTNSLSAFLLLCLLSFACQPKDTHTTATKLPESLAVSQPDTALLKDADFLIVPGKRVGPVRSNTSEADLLRQLGPAVVTVGDTIYGAEGETFSGTTLYKGTSDEVQILYKDADKRTHPELVLVRPTVTDDEGNPLPTVIPTRWRTADGLRIGTKLSELAQRNGKSFKLWGFGWDYGGTISDWQGGQFATSDGTSLLALTLGPPPKLTPAQEKAYNQVMGDSEFLSSLPAMKTLDPVIQTMSVTLEP